MAWACVLGWGVLLFLRMKTADFDYFLPEELIAARPLAGRADSRMLVVDRTAGTIAHRMFREFEDFFPKDHLLVLNDTRVVPARFFSDEGNVEFLRAEVVSERRWWCLAKPGKRMKVGRSVVVGACLGTVVELDEKGQRLIEWEVVPDLNEVGHLALPHYMGRPDEEMDVERYQTVFARAEGAIAAPTAGLHFTPELLARFEPEYLTLHVGVGTFRPVKAERPEDHEMHSENFVLSERAATRINGAKKVLAVGTTVTRVLEHLGRGGRALEAGAGATDIFIYPPYEFQVVDALLTNFHLPQSTLLMLVSAFAGRDLVLEAYRQAVVEKYRFFSYGDCMLIL